MSTQLNFKTLKARLDRFIKLESRHAAFLAILTVLVVYLLTVWQISRLANADPDTAVKAAAQNEYKVPKVDAEAIKQIQELEHRNSQIKSLFNNARNNPFQE